MSKINVLESRVYNRISAGEVVERPASAVKELVENAIDAGCTQITIEIENGGTKLIKISDNGSGIEYDDLPKVFLPHATSKIAKEDDLDAIETLGFRGEALASIGAVSQTEVVSKPRNSLEGGKISVEGSVISSPTPHASSDGTTITVRNLFFNTPARLKFLKSAKQEEGFITNIITRLMLSHPEISFKYVADGKTIYNAPLPGLKEKLFVIYGKGGADNLVEVNAKKGALTLKGYLSSPTSCKANRTYQTLIINGRYVSNPLVSVAISNAYSNFLMKGKFPLFVLSVQIPFEDIDVNVHPSKLEVRFKNTKEIYDFFYSSVLNALEESNFPLEVANLTSFSPNIMPDKKDIPQPEKVLSVVDSGFSFGNMKSFSDEINKITISSNEDEEPTSNVLNERNSFVSFDEDKPIEITDKSQSEQAIADDNFTMPNDSFRENIDKPFDIQQKRPTMQETLTTDIPFTVIGTLFNTYILVESEDNFFMIDQHAGHERIMFDRFMLDFNAKKLNSQPLLLPYLFEVNPLEKALVEDNMEVFFDMGFEIESFGGNSYRILSVPAILSGINLEEFVTESLSNLSKISQNNEQIKDHFATCACKAAVKGGQKLTDSEIEVLLAELLQKGRRLQCPHGRPVCVKLSKYEIEKMFKRIVS